VGCIGFHPRREGRRAPPKGFQPPETLFFLYCGKHNPVGNAQKGEYRQLFIDGKGTFSQQTNIKPHNGHIALIGLTALFLFECAAALEIEPTALFTAEIRFLAKAETLAKVEKQILGDITRALSYRIKQLGLESPPDSIPGTDNGPKMV
jgi:hypothetical protein